MLTNQPQGYGKAISVYHVCMPPLTAADQERLRRAAEEEVSDCPELLAILTGIAEKHGLQAAIEALVNAKRVFLALWRDGELDPDLMD